MESSSLLNKNEVDLIECATTCPGMKLNGVKANNWVYPINDTPRDYQISISKTALFNNTMVCLPTGMGKTLIASIVMYNYYRWFPNGKIIFMAPTKPLVQQQREACISKVAIQEFYTAEMTGTVNPGKRKSIWDEKRVFFCTPQILKTDLNKRYIDPCQIVCVVIDECHRATGEYAYVTCIHKIMEKNEKFRIVALSATPGRTKEVIQDIITNLKISKVEYRNESDAELQKYAFNRSTEEIYIKNLEYMDDCNHLIHATLRKVLKPLIDKRIIYNPDVSTIARYALVKQMDNIRGSKEGASPWVFISLSQGICLLTIKEFLMDSLVTAFNFLELSLDRKPAIQKLKDEKNFIEFVQMYNMLKFLSGRKQIHPKLSKLIEILQDHFENSEKPCSRVIVFSSLRESVDDIVNTLNENGNDKIKAKMFVGQGKTRINSGMKQKEQKQVLNDFRNYKFNTMVATCIGEEGLDIPEVDLIISYDGATSPLRDTQRQGRTARHSTGKMIYLLAQGKEENRYQKNKKESNKVYELLDNYKHLFEMYKRNPRMIPSEYNPEILKVNMVVSEKPMKLKDSDTDTEEILENARKIINSNDDIDEILGNTSKIICDDEASPILKESKALAIDSKIKKDEKCKEAEDECIIIDMTDESEEIEGKILPGKRKKEFKDDTIRSSKKLVIESKEDSKTGMDEKLFDACLKDIAPNDNLKPSWSDASGMMVKDSTDMKVTSSSTKAKDGVNTFIKTYNKYVTMTNNIRNDIQDNNSGVFMSTALEHMDDGSQLITPSKKSNSIKSSVKPTDTNDNQEEGSLSDLVFKVENYKNKRVLKDDSTTNSKSADKALSSSNEKTNIKNCEYLEVEAIVSGEETESEDEEDEAECEVNAFDEEEEMAEYIIEKESHGTNTSEKTINDSEDMLQFYRESIQQESFITPLKRERTFKNLNVLSKSVTPFSEQDSYDSSFVSKDKSEEKSG